MPLKASVKQVQTAYSLRMQGVPVKEIAQHLDVSPSAIYRWLEIARKDPQTYPYVRSPETEGEA